MLCKKFFVAHCGASVRLLFETDAMVTHHRRNRVGDRRHSSILAARGWRESGWDVCIDRHFDLRCVVDHNKDFDHGVSIS